MTARRPEKDYKILQSNVSTINPITHTSFQPIRHQNHVPASPMYDPGKPRQLDYGAKTRPGNDVYQPPVTKPPSPKTNIVPPEAHDPAYSRKDVDKGDRSVKKSYDSDDDQRRYDDRYHDRRDDRYDDRRDDRYDDRRDDRYDDRRDDRYDDRGLGRFYDTRLNLEEPKPTGRRRKDGFEPEEIHDYRGNRVVYHKPTPRAYSEKPEHYSKNRNHDYPHDYYDHDDEDFYERPLNPWDPDRRPVRRPSLPSRRETRPVIRAMPRGKNGGALFFVRCAAGLGYNKENLEVASHYFKRAITRDMGGRYLGMAERVWDFGYEKGNSVVGLFHFPSMEKALLFFQLDRNLRQPDFPPPYNHSAMWIVSNAYLPDNLEMFNTYLLSEVELRPGKTVDDFIEEFVIPFESYMHSNGAMPFVICSFHKSERDSIRGHTYQPHSIITCHLFQGPDHFRAVTSDESFAKFRAVHNRLTSERCSVFTLTKK